MKSEELSAGFYRTAGPSAIDNRAHRRKDDLRIVRKLCRRQHVILDLGCGVGRIKRTEPFESEEGQYAANSFSK